MESCSKIIFNPTQLSTIARNTISDFLIVLIESFNLILFISYLIPGLIALIRKK